MRVTGRQLRRLIRESLLLERKSDIIYRKFVDFIYNEIILKAESVLEVHAAYATKEDWSEGRKNQNYSNPKKSWLTRAASLLMDGPKQNDQWPALFFTMPSVDQSIYKSLFEKYLEYVGSADDIIFDNDINRFTYWVSLFSISIVAYHRGGDRAAGSMNGEGDLMVYYNPWGTFEWNLGGKVPVRYTNPELFTFDSLWKVKYDKATKLREDGQDLRQFITKNSETLRRLLEHEITHYINAIRSAKGGDTFNVVPWDARSKTGLSHTQEYIDSTEEIQARLIDAQNAFLRAPIIEEKDSQKYLTLKGEMFLFLKQGDRQEFILRFINQWYASNDPRFLYKNHSKSNQQRLMNRAFEFLQEVQQSEEYKKFVANSQYDNLPNLSDSVESDELVPFD